MKTLRPINIKQGRQLTQTTLFSFLEKRAARVGFEPTTHCLLADALTTELPRQLNGWVESKLVYTKAV